jgi:hypothetical protein
MIRAFASAAPEGPRGCARRAPGGGGRGCGAAATVHIDDQDEVVGVVIGEDGEAVVDERDAHRVVARGLVVVERVDQVRMRRHEGGEKAHVALHSLVRVQRHVDVAGLDVLERGRGDVGVHDHDVRLRLEHRGDRAFRRARLGDPECAEVRIGLQHRLHRLVGLVGVLV